MQLTKGMLKRKKILLEFHQLQHHRVLLLDLGVPRNKTILHETKTLLTDASFTNLWSFVAWRSVSPFNSSLSSCSRQASVTSWSLTSLTMMQVLTCWIGKFIVAFIVQVSRMVCIPVT